MEYAFRYLINLLWVDLSSIFMCLIVQNSVGYVQFCFRYVFLRFQKLVVRKGIINRFKKKKKKTKKHDEVSHGFLQTLENYLQDFNSHLETKTLDFQIRPMNKNPITYYSWDTGTFLVQKISKLPKIRLTYETYQKTFLNLTQIILK